MRHVARPGKIAPFSNCPAAHLARRAHALPMSLLNHQLELLAPARDADIGIEAINHGADAVYIGGPGFGARVSASNSVQDIERLAKHAHRFGSRIFVTHRPSCATTNWRPRARWPGTSTTRAPTC
jgi:hypothetical protein